MTPVLSRLVPLVARALLTVLGRRLMQRLERSGLRLGTGLRAGDKPSDKSER